MKAFLTILISMYFLFTSTSVNACTIFFLTDQYNSLFFSNEDYTNPNTNIWFRKGNESLLGCVFVGFNNGEAQGGMNEAGLTFEYWADGAKPFEMDKTKQKVKGHAAERMLETCKTVEEAIKFYKTYQEPAFANLVMFIADKSGNSVIIRSIDGEINFDQSNQSRAIGFYESTYNTMFKDNPEINLGNGTEILKSCIHTGIYATKYSTIYNLKTGDIEIHQFEIDSKPVKLNLFEELSKENHYYDIPKIEKQVTQNLKKLPINMKRLAVFKFTAIPDYPFSKIAEEMISNLSIGKIETKNYISTFWTNVDEEQTGIQKMLDPYGEIQEIHLVDIIERDSITDLYYLTIYNNGRIIWKFSKNENDLIEDLKISKAFLE
jgi:hypothetical protein